MTLLLCHIFFLAFHPIHIGLTDMKYNSANRSVEIIHKIFIDDMEDEIEKESGARILIDGHDDPEEVRSLILAYIDRHFSISINGKTYKPEFIGFETDLEAVWIYQEVKGISQVARVEASLTALLDFYPDQKNIVHMRVGGQKESLLLNGKSRKGVLAF